MIDMNGHSAWMGSRFWMKSSVKAHGWKAMTMW
jgi:hypothetical protein